jgi:hypothetical protein
MAKLKATLHGVRLDRDGKGRITLTVPSSDTISLLAIATMTNVVLDVEIKEEGKA